MLLTITRESPPATDLGWLLHKNPERVQRFDLAFGQAIVFYSEASEQRCTAVLMLQIDPIALIRRPQRGDAGFALKQYVNSEYATGTWRCPTHEQLLYNSRSTSSYGYNWQHLLEPDRSIGYPYNYYYGFDQPGMRQSMVDVPSKTLTYAEHHAQGALWTYIQRPGDISEVNGMGRLDLRHEDNSGNVAFLDGHGESVGEEVVDAANENEYWAALS